MLAAFNVDRRSDVHERTRELKVTEKGDMTEDKTHFMVLKRLC